MGDAIEGRTHDIPLADARALIQRAIDKAEQLGLRGGIAVVGASGALVSTSRMDRGGAGGMTRARSKAWISGTQQVPSAEHLARMNFVSPPVEQGFKTASPEALFPGAGGMPISVVGPHGAEIIGGIAASGATVSPFFPAGIAQENMIADGRPANPEDLLIHYALRLPYVGQQVTTRRAGIAVSVRSPPIPPPVSAWRRLRALPLSTSTSGPSRSPTR